MRTGDEISFERRRTSQAPPLRRVLCVDDDAAVARLLVRWLRRAGYDAVASSEPLNAADQLITAARPFDALITDQHMPRMTGLELSRFAVAARPRLVVFLATAEADRILPDDLAASGVSYLVPKPFDVPAVLAALRESLGAPRSARLSLV